MPTWSSRRSRSCTCRADCARLRDARRRRKWKTLLNHAVMPARARRGWPVSRSPIASTIETMNPNGMSHSNVPSEYDVSSTRTRLRAIATSSGRSERARSSAASRCATRASGTTSTRAPDETRSPAEVEVFGAGERRGIEPAERGEEVDAHEHRGARDVEHVAHAVVLLLIELSGLDPRVRRPEAVDGAPDVEQHARGRRRRRAWARRSRRSSGTPPRPACGRHPGRARRRRGRRAGTSRPRLRSEPRWRPRRSPRSRAGAGRTRPAAARRPVADGST